MAKFEEAEARIQKNIYICRRCKSKMRAPALKVISGKIKCRKCKYSALRPRRKK